MHRSRLSTILIDTPAADAQASAAFWSGALGVAAVPNATEPEFIGIRGVHPDFTIAVQALGEGEPRYHFDIETDDVPAEVERLTALGAVKIQQWLDCHTFRVPGGQLVCVIPVHSAPEVFARLAHEWA